MKSMLIRTTQQVKQKLGKADKTVDEEFETLRNSAASTEKSAANFTKHVNQLVENYHALTTIMGFIAEDVKEMNKGPDDNSLVRQKGEVLSSVVDRIETNTVIPFQNNMKSRAVDPVLEYTAQFQPLKEVYNHKSKMQLEYDYHREQVEKLSGTQQKDPTKLPKAKEKLNIARENYENSLMNAKQGTSEVLSKKDMVFDDAIDHLFSAIVQFHQQMEAQTKSLN